MLGDLMDSIVFSTCKSSFLLSKVLISVTQSSSLDTTLLYFAVGVVGSRSI